MHFLRISSIVACSIVAIVVAGCGGAGEEKVKAPDVSPASGVLTYNDKPVEGAQIIFLSSDSKKNGWSCAGKSDAAGKFEIVTAVSTARAKGVPPGDYNVIVTKTAAPVALDAAKQKEMAEKAQAAQTANPSTPVNVPKSEIPVKYGVEDQSGLKVNIDKAGNTNIELKLVD